MKFNREDIILITTKYTAYLINILIVAAIVGVVGGFGYTLYLSAR